MNDAAVVQKKGMSTGAKVGIGCGIGCLALIILVAAGIYIGTRVVLKKINEVKAELVALGFEEQRTAQAVDVNEEITSPQLLLGQVVKVYADCSTNLAIMAQLAEIHGTINGSLYFCGQVLTISPKGRVTGDLDVMCQVLDNQGTVDGEIRGVWQQDSND